MHKLDSMSKLKITESSKRSSNIIYLYTSLGDVMAQMQIDADVKNGNNRCELKISLEDNYKELFIAEVEDRIADIIAINYKYNFFKKNINLTGLKERDKEILLCALISADIEEDKKYIVRKLKYFTEYAIDGIFNFRMRALKEKWYEIVSYIPSSFTANQLKEFICYLIKDKRNKRVYVENDNVYDKYFNTLQKTQLLDNLGVELTSLKEIILSGAGEVELGSKLDETTEKYIKEFYGDRVYFADSYYFDHNKKEI